MFVGGVNLNNIRITEYRGGWMCLLGGETGITSESPTTGVCVCGGNLNNIRITDYRGVCVCGGGGNLNNIRITDYRGGCVVVGGGLGGG